MIVCQEAYHLNTLKNKLTLKSIEGHTQPCPVEELPGKEKAKAGIIKHLSDRNYDASTIQ